MMDSVNPNPAVPSPQTQAEEKENNDFPKEIGGRKQGLDPTRYGDWELNGRCVDF